VTDRDYILNEQFICLALFSQIDQPDLAWRTKIHKIYSHALQSNSTTKQTRRQQPLPLKSDYHNQLIYSFLLLILLQYRQCLAHSLLMDQLHAPGV
jgi:hypothetical protein